MCQGVLSFTRKYSKQALEETCRQALHPPLSGLLTKATKASSPHGWSHSSGSGSCGCVTLDEMGKLFRPNYVTDHFKLLLQQNGLRHIRFHDLRHSCASLLLSQGIAMKQIQDWLGHSTFATTADIYSHLDFNSKQESADAIAAAFMPEETAEEEQVQGFSMTMSM